MTNHFFILKLFLFVFYIYNYVTKVIYLDHLFIFYQTVFVYSYFKHLIINYEQQFDTILKFYYYYFIFKKRTKSIYNISYTPVFLF